MSSRYVPYLVGPIIEHDADGLVKVQTSCGYGVPRLSRHTSCDLGKAPETAFEDRDTISHWGAKKVEKNELIHYQESCNTRSLDGLLALNTARRGSGERMWLTDIKARANRILTPKESVVTGMFIGILLVLLAQLGVGVLKRYSVERTAQGMDV